METLSAFPGLGPIKQHDNSSKGEKQRQLIMQHDQYLVNLQTFVCAADHLSFLATAEFLCITPSAVSHRIRKLERYLGFSLFQRLSRQLILTKEGRGLYFVLQEALDQVYLEVQDIRMHRLSGAFNIYSHPSVANDWLIPRLASFADEYPSIQINIRTSNEQVDFQRQNYDIALYYSSGNFIGLDSILFMEEESFPVCSPLYAERYKLFNKPENLEHCTLLHDANSWHYAVVDAEWQAWSKLGKIHLPKPRSFMTFDSSRSAIYAGIHHAGVAMGRLSLIKEWLSCGRLMDVFPDFPRLKSVYNYYAVWPKHRKDSHKLEIFVNWLIKQGR